MREKLLRIDGLSQLVRTLKSKLKTQKFRKAHNNHNSENIRLKDIVIELNQRISSLENTKRELSKDNLQLESQNSNLRKEITKIRIEKDSQLENM